MDMEKFQQRDTDAYLRKRFGVRADQETIDEYISYLNGQRSVFDDVVNAIPSAEYPIQVKATGETIQNREEMEEWLDDRGRQINAIREMIADLHDEMIRLGW